MKFKTLEELLNCIMYDIMKSEYDRYLSISFGKTEILMFVFEQQIPIKISYHKTYDSSLKLSKNIILAEVNAELLRTNIGTGWLGQLDEICATIDNNSDVFKSLIRKEE